MSLVPSRRMIGLCTDFGLHDYRLSALKAEILRVNQHANILDISHEVTPFDLTEAAFLVSNALPHFPPKSIHVVWVFNTSEDRGILMAKIKDQYVIAPNNGLAGLMADDHQRPPVYRISDDCFSYKQRIADTIRLLVEQDEPEKFFEEMPNPVFKINLNPVYQKDRIQARIIYIDRFGNIVFNIRKEPFEQACMERRFSIITAAHQAISYFHLGEEEKENGSFYVNFTDSGYLKLALCGSRAANTLDVKKDDQLQIHFE